MTNEIINKVAESGIITLNLEEFYPKEAIKTFDLKNFLFMELILKEKDYRAALQNQNWSDYENTNVCITCSTDAIVPVWAYMLAASYLQPLTKNLVFGDEKKLIDTIITKNIEALNDDEFIDKRVVVKGCGDIAIPETAYIAITNKLRPVAKSIMYGEPCSTVPIYKKPISK